MALGNKLEQAGGRAQRSCLYENGEQPTSQSKTLVFRADDKIHDERVEDPVSDGSPHADGLATTLGDRSIDGGTKGPVAVVGARDLPSNSLTNRPVLLGGRGAGDDLDHGQR